MKLPHILPLSLMVAAISITFLSFQASNHKIPPIESQAQADSIFRINGEAVNPLLIAAFLPWEGDRPTTISIDLRSGHNRFFINGDVYDNWANFYQSKDWFKYIYVGKTTNDIYVLKTILNKEGKSSYGLLFLSLAVRDNFHREEQRDTLTLLNLEKFYTLNEKTAISITGNNISITNSNGDKIDVSTDDDNSSKAIQDNHYPPVISNKELLNDWTGADKNFSFHGRPISPYLINEIDGAGYSLSDGPSTMVVDLEAGTSAKQFLGAVDDLSAHNMKVTGYTTAEYRDYAKDTIYSNYYYEYLGRTTNGVHVIRTVESGGGGTGVFNGLRFIRFRVRKNFDCNGNNKDQLLMCLEGTYEERDRNTGSVKIEGNKVYIDLPERETWYGDPIGTVHSVLQF